MAAFPDGAWNLYITESSGNEPRIVVRAGLLGEPTPIAVGPLSTPAGRRLTREASLQPEHGAVAEAKVLISNFGRLN